ncbi:MAG: MFS transporter [Opitutales bacterium]|nr:MFS transporter [Opitutales bacterium]
MSNKDSEPDMKLFWGCFIALITTAFAFITRAFLVNAEPFWPSTFGLDQVQAQELFGAGIWPFAISIIVFSLIIDNIGYRAAMIFSFVCYAGYAFLAFQAYGIVMAEGLAGEELKTAQGLAYDRLYWGSVILGLGNGTVEAFINPVVATMFKKDKTKWLNILHAGWPGGLVIGGILTILLGAQAAEDWRILIYLIAIPAVVYLLMLMKAKFPVNERVESGTSYKEMLAEFGAIGALIAGYLIYRQLGMVFGWDDNIVYLLTAVSTIAYFLYCKSLGRPLLIFMCIIMVPLATTELGTDGAISGLMEEPMKAAGYNGLWVLIYTSAIMMVLRFWFAGPIVAKLGPLGLLATSAVLAIAGLYLLSSATGLTMIFVFATLYGFGKTFFWPTTLGVVSEQCPKGGALTLNAIAGIGMLAVGILGGPVIGKMTEDSIKASVEATTTEETYTSISNGDTYFLGEYTAVDPEKVAALPAEKQQEVKESIQSGKQGSLASVAVFPVFMLVCYLALIFYFKAKGGYKPVEI